MDGRAQETRAAAGGDAPLRERVIAQAPGVFVTLLSILVGLVLSDLVTEARGRMRLWPLDLVVLRSWGQLAGNGVAAISSWMVMVHLGVARRGLPRLSDSVSTFGPPLLVLCATTFVGRAATWPWLYGAGIYLVACIVAVGTLIRNLRIPGEPAVFATMMRPTGPFAVLYLGAPAYLLAGLAGQLGRLPPVVDMALTLGATPASGLVVWMFFRDWRAALGAAEFD
ncbi:MAG: hypothetical protein JSR86_05380 [Proteobacteria bacterium]|nr:hypothetical protein [Pseudomonadota bacterium]